MAVLDGIVQELRRSRQVGQSAVFISVDGSGTEVRLPTEYDRHLGEPDTIGIIVTTDDISDLQEDADEAAEPVTDAEIAAEVATEAAGEAAEADGAESEEE